MPLVSDSNSPIFFVGVGLTRMGYNLVRRMMNEGFYVNLGIFPAVPESCTGIRFTITNHLTFEDIENLAKKMAYHLPLALEEENRTMDDIFRAFKKLVNLEEKIKPAAQKNKIQIPLHLEKYNSIYDINKELWNSLLKNNGAFDDICLANLEHIFSNNPERENNWKFLYYFIKDDRGNTVLATFFTLCLIKDDMMADAIISEKIEQERINEPYYLTSYSLMMGSLLTDGNHLYINREHKLWKQALIKLLDAIWEEQEKCGANSIFFRDFDEADEELRGFFMDNGFVKVAIGESSVVNNKEKISQDTFFKVKLDSQKKRKALEKEILANSGNFRVSIDHTINEKADEYYNLYMDVKKRSFKLNTFALPKKFFENLGNMGNWEVIRIQLEENKKLVCALFCAKTKNNYCGTIIGMDYSIDKSFNLYKQSLYQAIKRGLELNSEKIFLGLTASEAKHKLGADVYKKVMFVQMKDHYNNELIESMKMNLS